MEDIAIYGAGGLGRETAFLIDQINKTEGRYNLIGFYDDGEEFRNKKILNKFPHLGGINDLNSYDRPLNLALAFGVPRVLKAVQQKIVNQNIAFPNLYHPVILYYEGYYNIGIGNIFGMGCVISCDVTIKDFNIFNSGITLGHDTTVGSYNVFNPRILISGNVSIGDENMLGLNTAILQGKKLGNNNVLAPGSILYNSKKNDKFLMGNPAKEIDLG